MNPWLLLTVLTLIALAAPRYGVDSRWPPPGEPPRPPSGPTPRGDLAAAGAWLLRLARRAREWAVHPVASRPARP
jgi:hypothetical protein